MERAIRKIITFLMRQIALNFEENNTEASVTSKRLKFPYDERTDTSFIAPLRMHF